MNKSAILIFLPAFALFFSCSKKAAPAYDSGVKQSDVQKEIIAKPTIMSSEPRNMVLKATVFKMNGNYANNVAVTLGANGNLIYFPAPSDIKEESVPKEIGEGWWLNCQGLGPNSVFTKYTFKEYAALKSAPSPAEIKDAIIPGARVVEFRQLSIPASDARNLPPTDLLQFIN